MHLFDLATETILNVASHLAQPDLLNVTLTHRRLRDATESALFREYTNRHIYGRSLKPFVLRLIDRPELAKYVHWVDLKAYRHIADLNPEHGPISDGQSDLEHCTAEEYDKLTRAAIKAGVITEALPYEPTSSILKIMTTWEYQEQYNEENAEGWYNNIYGEDIDEVTFDEIFCKLLRIGIDEPFLIVLLALLPNL
ncbi:hypothetical protein EK21DRAFT_113850 [Setomelanomma holmii]|uniref:F-box domain-containing protein n=1 Tax=Setomelanomma holmii TaxID=210430 RepID=A0A9P4H5E6_9PLEO|nr:hypothetical protein EK21DRAFT_113850 [Setomelanomma holmii]